MNPVSQSNLNIHLVLPIGICGMGKSTFSRYLYDSLQRCNQRVYLIERDAIFQEIRDRGISLKKTKKELYLKYQTIMKEIIDDSVNDSANDYVNNKTYVIMDTSNVAEETRNLSISLFQPTQVYEIYFAFPQTIQVDDVYQLLKSRIYYREGHPTFPKKDKEEEQVRILNHLWRNFIEMPEFYRHQMENPDMKFIEMSNIQDNIYNQEYNDNKRRFQINITINQEQYPNIEDWLL
jgi:hypothetical protein